MRKWILLFAVILSVLSFAPMRSVEATDSLAHRLSGRILLQVEENGEAWYIDPLERKRYYLGRPHDAFQVMREKGLGIKHAELMTYLNTNFPSRLSGRILLDVEENGEAYYVDPLTLTASYLGRPHDAFHIMRAYGLGITNAHLGLISIADGSATPPSADNTVSSPSYEHKMVSTSVGSFSVRIATLPRSAFDMITDTASAIDCETHCDAIPLADYVAEHGAFAGIHGTYFCPPDYVSCASQVNSFLPPVFNSSLDTMINEDSMRWHERPFIAATDSGTLHYFHRMYEFGDSVASFEKTYDTQMSAGIGNWPSLVESGTVVVNTEPQEGSFSTKATRGGIGWNESNFLLVIAHSASVSDLAYIFEALNADYAMNLDGGGSAALYYNSSYKYGPGRDLPNGILFKRR